MTSPATGITRYLRIHSRMRGAVVARVIPVPLETNLEGIRDIHKVIRSNRVAFISLTTHGGSNLLLFLQSKSNETMYDRLVRSRAWKVDYNVFFFIARKCP